MRRNRLTIDFGKIQEKLTRNLYFPFRIFTFLTLFFLVGTLLASFISFDFIRCGLIFLGIIFALFITAFINLILKNRFVVLLSFSFAALTLALFYFSYFDWSHAVTLPFGQEVEITGKIIKNPATDYKSQKLVIQVPSGQITNKKTNILVTAPHFPEYHYGETLTIKGRIEEPQNFSDFDYKNYLKRQLIFGLISKPENLTYIQARRGIYDDSLGALYDFSNYFEQSTNQVLPEPQASLASGLILGVKRNIPDNLIADLQTTSLTHIIALSGYNVTILVAVLMVILSSYIGRNKTIYIGSGLIILFVLMTGAASSVVRAAIFSLLLLFGKLIGRRADQTNLMLLAALLMVLVNPFVLVHDLGFQLSFFAFAGLIYLAEPITKWLEKWRTRRWPELIRKPLAETLGAQIAVAPLILVQFGMTSLIAPISNLLVVWMVPWAMLLSFIAGFCAMIYYPLGRLAGLLAWPTLTYIIKMVEWLAQVPWAAIHFK